MKKILVALTLMTSISGIAGNHDHGHEVNVNVNPVINFNPTITVSPTITNTNNNTNKTVVTVNNSDRYSDDVSKVKNVDIRPLLIEIKKINEKLSKLEAKDAKLEKLVEILGKEEAKPIIEAKRKKMEAEYKKLAKKQISLVQLIKKLEKDGTSIRAKDGKIGSRKVHKVQKKNAKGIVLFKTNAEKKEWKLLEKKHPKLLNLIIKTAQFTKKNFDKPLVLTELHRTQAEQDKLYGGKATKKSWHQFWSAVDFRSRIFTNAEIVQIIDFIKTEFKGEGKKLRVLYHRISGSVYHFHVTLKK